MKDFLRTGNNVTNITEVAVQHGTNKPKKIVAKAMLAAENPMLADEWDVGCLPKRDMPVSAIMKARQTSKIREIGDALLASGFSTLDEQAKLLGLSRSTVWTLLKANHKNSGLSAAVISRMLSAPQLPALVRAKIIEYTKEKSEGIYGHRKLPLRRFTRSLAVRRCTVVRVERDEQLSAACA